jgi:hypothetical protein
MSRQNIYIFAFILTNCLNCLPELPVKIAVKIAIVVERLTAMRRYGTLCS